ncbi:uncharacterized protein BJ171DRAFT_126691 [Polychytrium aggregatum]|uniref:uncharacterized protein n=1 Tax=Polychytrium aggregatum TaxID=110093 RepID=UPI0022FDBF92|nr:uncharacterized protein BJ171DRAFT_126691 [Polychytrium aggregatum]KAI9203970.1 hypothetical protein BJ171DRAFT_126691 [Polychytrium aggregatum]
MLLFFLSSLFGLLVRGRGGGDGVDNYGGGGGDGGFLGLEEGGREECSIIPPLGVGFEQLHLEDMHGWQERKTCQLGAHDRHIRSGEKMERATTRKGNRADRRLGSMAYSDDIDALQTQTTKGRGTLGTAGQNDSRTAVRAR